MCVCGCVWGDVRGCVGMCLVHTVLVPFMGLGPNDAQLV